MTALAEKIGFNQETFETFLAARTEPSWLTDARRAAWAKFNELSFPANSDEEWSRTDIRLFKLDRFSPPASESLTTELPESLLAQGASIDHRLVAINSVSVRGNNDPGLEKQGILFGSLDQLLLEHGDLIRPYFERHIVDQNHDKFSALHAACWSGGTLLYVPKGVCLEAPLHSLAAMTDGGVDFSKVLVIVEDGAEATLISETASESPQAGGFHCGSIELIVGANARLRYVNLQNWGNKVWHFAHQRAVVGDNAELQWTIGALGSRLAKVNQRVALIGKNAFAQVNGVMFTVGKQHMTYNTHQHHEASDCRSDLLYKNALQDSSRTVWSGMIRVDKEAQRTDAYQRNDNLMLSVNARADSIPGLEIEADDVRCTHGSTSGRVNDEQLFYAMSRGFTRKEAVRMIVTGFFQQVIDRITIESVREALADAIGKRVQDIEE